MRAGAGEMAWRREQEQLGGAIASSSEEYYQRSNLRGSDNGYDERGEAVAQGSTMIDSQRKGHLFEYFQDDR